MKTVIAKANGPKIRPIADAVMRRSLPLRLL